MSKKDTGWVTAAQFQAMVSQDPVYQAKVAAREARQQADLKVWAEAEKPLIAELAAAGIAVESAWDLINVAPKKAVPILLKHLQEPYPNKVREGIARALPMPEARQGWSILVAEFEKESDTLAGVTKGAIGATIAAAAQNEDLEEVVRLVRDKRHGGSRVTLLGALGRSKLPLAEEVLNEMLEDEDCRVEARFLLNRRIRNAERRLKRKRKKEQES